MKLNGEKFDQEIFKEEFGGKLTRCATAMGLTVQHLDKVVKSQGKEGVGSLFLGKLKRYCDDSGRNFDEFIFLPEA